MSQPSSTVTTFLFGDGKEYQVETDFESFDEKEESLKTIETVMKKDFPRDMHIEQSRFVNRVFLFLMWNLLQNVKVTYTDKRGRLVKLMAKKDLLAVGNDFVTIIDKDSGYLDLLFPSFDDDDTVDIRGFVLARSDPDTDPIIGVRGSEIMDLYDYLISSTTFQDAFQHNIRAADIYLKNTPIETNTREKISSLHKIVNVIKRVLMCTQQFRFGLIVKDVATTEIKNSVLKTFKMHLNRIKIETTVNRGTENRSELKQSYESVLTKYNECKTLINTMKTWG